MPWIRVNRDVLDPIRIRSAAEGRRGMHVEVLQHVPFEGPAEIASILEQAGHVTKVTHLYAGDPLPDPAQTEALVVMGGPMSVHDGSQHAWLPDEVSLIRDAADRGVPVLGICLGAQLIAAALGVRVYRGPEKEIGWFPVTMTPEAESSRLTAQWPREARVLHWHGDTFDLPSGARLLAHSRAYRNQAFEVNGHVVGLQFHLEMMSRDVREIVKNSRDELVPGAFVQSEEEILRDAGGSEISRMMLSEMLQRWIEPNGGSDE